MDKYDEKACELLPPDVYTAPGYQDMREVFAQALRDVAREVREEDAQIVESTVIPAQCMHVRTRIAAKLRAAKEVPNEEHQMAQAKPEVTGKETARVESTLGANRERKESVSGNDALSDQRVTPPGVEQAGSGQECAAKSRECCAARKVLREVRQYLPQIDNGMCAMCRIGRREWQRQRPGSHYMVIGPCSNENCITHRLEAALAQPCQPAMTRQEAERIADAALCNPAHVYTRHWLPGSYRELRDSVADALQRVSGGDDRLKAASELLQRALDALTPHQQYCGCPACAAWTRETNPHRELRAAISAHLKEPKP